MPGLTRLSNRLQVGRAADWPGPVPGILADEHILQQAIGRGGPGPGALGHCTQADADLVYIDILRDIQMQHLDICIWISVQDVDI